MSIQWLSEHGSAITVLILIMLGIVFFFVGNSLSSKTDPLLNLVSIVIVQFGGTLIVAAIATIIFSFRDIRESIAKVASQLLANAEVIPLLSKEAKDRLEERIVLDRLGATVSMMQPDIYEAFSIVRDQYLSTFHLQNFTEDITLSPHPSNTAFVYRESTRLFKVIPHHLANSNRTFSLCYRAEIGIPKDISISKKEFLNSFNVRVGDYQFGSNDVDVDESMSGSLRVMRLLFNRPIEVKSSLDVKIYSCCLAWADDNVDVFRVRYPTNGFRVVLRYLESLEYDASWFKLFKAITPEAGFELDKANINPQVNGITVYTHDWLFPGEGVAISWHTSRTDDKVKKTY